MLLLTLGRWQYDYYIALRFVVRSGRVGNRAGRPGQGRKLEIVFNPFTPFHLPRSDWRVLNLIAAGILM